MTQFGFWIRPVFRSALQNYKEREICLQLQGIGKSAYSISNINEFIHKWKQCLPFAGGDGMS